MQVKFIIAFGTNKHLLMEQRPPRVQYICERKVAGDDLVMIASLRRGDPYFITFQEMPCEFRVEKREVFLKKQDNFEQECSLWLTPLGNEREIENFVQLHTDWL